MARPKRLSLESLEIRLPLAANVLAAPAVDPVECIPGDANCDGVFDSSDLVQVFQAGEYEDEIKVFDDDHEYKGTKNCDNSTWSEGDWNGDQDFTAADLVLAMTHSDYADRHEVTPPVSPSPLPGDANQDGVFDSSDLVQVFQAGEYEDEIKVFDDDHEYKGTKNTDNSTWAEGDWNGDLDFTSADLVFAMQSGGYRG